MSSSLLYLKEENKAFKVEKYEHTYPHCWRTDKPVLYYPLDSWFIKTTALKDKMVEVESSTIQLETGVYRNGSLRKLAGKSCRLEFIAVTLLGNTVTNLENERWERRNVYWFG
jgi:valyl-tRNA synthetase